MKAKIRKSMLLVISATLVVTFILLSTIFYFEIINRMKAEVKQEAIYIQRALEISGIHYLEDMDQAQALTRITLIDPAGNVVYDSKEDEYTFENHAERKEVKNALVNGTGEDIRTSSTIGKTSYYYAILMEDGMVLRVAKMADSLMPILMSIVPYMIGIVLVMFLMAYYLAKWQTNRLIEPINALDLSKPLENEVYEELTPLLRRIHEQNRAKEEITNMRKEFSANVSHELKTPLTSISGYAEIMKSGLVKEEDMVSFSERIYNEASRLIALIGDIIKLSKLDDENVELEKEWVDLYSLAKDVGNRLSLLAENKKIHFELEGETAEVYGVRQILDEMIYNISENAIKYNEYGGKVKVEVWNTSQGPSIAVRDTGIGIPENQLERIFERFYRVDKSHSKETGGTGLGLSIVKHGAIYHRAQIFVESEVGKGTTMKILFEN